MFTAAGRVPCALGERTTSGPPVAGWNSADAFTARRNHDLNGPEAVTAYGTGLAGINGAMPWPVFILVVLGVLLVCAVWAASRRR